MEAAKDENVTYKTPENAKEIAGHGSVITIDNSEILAGNKKIDGSVSCNWRLSRNNFLWN